MYCARSCYTTAVRVAALVPAFQAEHTIEAVVSELVRIWPEPEAVFVVDDGSSDSTAAAALRQGAIVVRHARNHGKGAALRTGLQAARARGFDVAVSLDADGQHPPTEALRLHESCGEESALVLGIRDLPGAGAPRANQLSNRFSNVVLSGFAGRRFGDTQCGLRRYPIDRTLALGCRDEGYAFEAEVLLCAAAVGVPIVELPITVLYPPEEQRVTHFDSVRDPTRIVLRVVRTVLAIHGRRLLGRPQPAAQG